MSHAVTTPSPEQQTNEDPALVAKLRNAAAQKRQVVTESGRQALIHIATIIPDARNAKSNTPIDELIGEIGPRRIALEDGDPDLDEAYQRVRNAFVPRRFHNARLGNYQPETPTQRKALAAVTNWVVEARAGVGGMLALIGPTGCGKSHLLYSAANDLIADASTRRECYSRPWFRLADELRYGGASPFMPSRRLESWEIRDSLTRHDIVLLDEVRPTASTAFDDTELAKFACGAYDANSSVMMTTNVFPLAEVMGPPAASRFTQIVIDGPDWRQRR